MSVSPLDPESSASTNSATLTLFLQQTNSIRSNRVLQVRFLINLLPGAFLPVNASNKTGARVFLVIKVHVIAAIVANM